MNTFLKVVLVFIAAVVAIKVLPFAFGVVSFVTAAMFGIFGLGLSLIATMFAGLIILGAVLSPIWVPVLAIVGIVALCSRSNRNTATPVV